VFLYNFLLIFLFFFTCLPKLSQAQNYIQGYRERIIVNYTLDNFYTGQLDGKIFLAKNLFSNNPFVLIANLDSFSEGIYLEKCSDKYVLFSNIMDPFPNRSSLLVSYFHDSGSNIKVLKNKIFKLGDGYNAINFINSYYNSNEMIFVMGLVRNVFDVDISISYFDGDNMSKALTFGSDSYDYPIYFGQYKDYYFNGYMFIGLVDRINYKDFYDFKMAIQTKRFVSDTLLICFIDSNMKIKKYFAIMFPGDIVDYSIVRNSIDSALVRIDFIDRAYREFITQNFINISFSKTTLLDNTGNSLRRFYKIDNPSNFKAKELSFYQWDMNISYRKTNLTINYFK